MIEAVDQQLARHVFRMTREVKWDAVGLGVPITTPYFSPVKAFGTDVQSSIVTAIGLIQVKNIETNGLL